MQNDEAVRPNVTSYNTLMNAYVAANDARARRVFADMQNDEAVQPDVTSYSTLMNAYVAANDAKKHSACSMRCRMTRRCAQRHQLQHPDERTWPPTTPKKHSVFNEMQNDEAVQPDVTSYSTLMAYIVEGDSQGSEKVFSDMKANGVELNVESVTFSHGTWQCGE